MSFRRRLVALLLFVIACVPGWWALRLTLRPAPSHQMGAAENYANPIGPAGTGAVNGLGGAYPWPTVAALPTAGGTPGTCPVWDDAGTLHGSTACGGPDGSVPAAQYAPALYNNGTSTYLVDITGPTDGGPVSVPATGAHFDYAADAAPLFTQDPAASGAGHNFIVSPQQAATGAADAGSGSLVVNVAPASGSAPHAGVIVQEDGGTSAVLAENAGGYGALCLGSGIAADAGQYNCAVQGGAFGNTVFGANTTYTWNSGAGTALMFLQYNTTFGDLLQVNPHTLLLNSAGAHSTAPVIVQPTATVGATALATIVNGASASPSSSSPFQNGAAMMACGGAASTNGTTGLRGGFQAGLGGGLGAGTQQDCPNEIALEVGEPVLGSRGVALGQLGTGMTSSNSIVNGDGWTWFAPASTVTTTAPKFGTQCWNGASGLTCWNAGAGSAFVVGSGGGGGCSIAGDVTGSCGANTVQTLTGNGSGVVSVVANNFAYAGGGLLQWTSSGSFYAGAAGAMTVASTGGAAQFLGATTAELGAVGLATVQGGSVQITSTGTTITETPGTSWAVNAGTSASITAASFVAINGATGVTIGSSGGVVDISDQTLQMGWASSGAAKINATNNSLSLSSSLGNVILAPAATQDMQIVVSSGGNLSISGVTGYVGSTATAFFLPAGTTCTAGMIPLRVNGTVFYIPLCANSSP